MKKTIEFKKLFLAVIIIALLALLAYIPFQPNIKANPGNRDQTGITIRDTVKYQSYSGRIVDQMTKKPVVFANVYLIGSNIGTVTNSEGEFLIKVPVGSVYLNLGITHLGYKNQVIELAQLNKENNVIYIDPATIPIDEVTIRAADPLELLFLAKRRIPDNYSTWPVMFTSFYRETIKQNKSYVAVAEAVIDVYKAPYQRLAEVDRSKIYKGRKSQDVKKMDTVLFKLQGGSYSALLLDLVKNPGEILSDEYFELYNYKLSGLNYVNDRPTYVIEFTQLEMVNEPLYEGKIYIDVNDLAITGVDFKLNDKELEQATEMFIRKKPIGMKINVLGANYITKYREVGGIWYLNYVRLETQFKCNWQKKLFNSVYSTTTEMAITDIDSVNVNKFKYKESSKFSDIITEQVSQFEDPEFWGEYNIIKPEESIEAAIEKINKKLKRRL